MFYRLVTFFLPQQLRNNPANSSYQELRMMLGTILIGLPLMSIFPVVIYFLGMPIIGFLINLVLLLTTLACIKYFGHYRIPLSITALVTYYIIYGWIAKSGLIYSPNLAILHMYLLAAIWADKKYGWYAIFSNLLFFYVVYQNTINAQLPFDYYQRTGGPLYALSINALITVFFGGFLYYLQSDQERNRIHINNLQTKRITLLDELVKKRTEELDQMREAIATDFHDETGNMLSAITRQASLLQMRLAPDHISQPIVANIIANSDKLYASSKDFLWHLSHESDDPQELFNYLTAYGQGFYNQFGIAFSSKAVYSSSSQLAPSAAINLIYIFKEAMNNVIKHAEAREVLFELDELNGQFIFALLDDGKWKEMDLNTRHYGLANIERRCKKNNFGFKVYQNPTKLIITVPQIVENTYE